MRYLTLFTDAKSWLAMDGKVIPAGDVESVESALELASALSKRLTEAEAEMEEIKKAARAEIEKIKKAAKVAAYSNGFAEGVTAASKQSLKEVSAVKAAYATQTQLQENQVIDLTLAVVKRVAGDVASDEWLTAQARQAIAALRQKDDKVRLMVHASQVDKVQSRINTLQQSGDVQALSIQSVEPSEDDDVNTCRLEVSVGGAVVVDLNTQLNAINAVLNPVQLAEGGV